MKEKEKKLIYSPAIMNKLRECIRGRAGKAEELFKTELFNVAQSIAENEDSLYHSFKSDILKGFPIFNNDSITEATINDSAMIIDLSLFTKSHHFNENATFIEYANSLRERI